MDRKEKSELEGCYNTIKQLEQRCALLENCTQDLEKRLEAQAREKLQIERHGVETERDLHEELRRAEIDKEDLRGELLDKDSEIRDLEEKLRRVHSNVQEYHKRKYDPVYRGGGGVREEKSASIGSLSGLIGKGEPPAFVDVKGHGKFPLGAALARAGSRKSAGASQGTASGKATARDKVVQHELADFFNMGR